MKNNSTEFDAALVDSLERALETHNHVEVVFTTKRGTIRAMDCSKNNTVPLEGRDEPKLIHPSIIAVYDYQNSAWRSFRKDSVISYKVIS